MPRSIHLINPATDFPVYYGADVFARIGLAPAAFVADLTTATVAAAVPAGFSVSICDEHISPADVDHPAEVIGITGKTSQRSRMVELAQAYRRRGKTVIIGGPYASLVPGDVRPFCDILVRGEIETCAGQLFDDIRAGQWQAEYRGAPADLATSPVPRWDLYPTTRALQGCLQTSRGCPFRCDFCDTIEYVGRRQRHKPVDMVIRELDVLYRHGFRTVFLADDNFTAHRGKAGEILSAISDFNRLARRGRVHLSSQLSIDAADDPELLGLCRSAGLTEAFVGVETPRTESLQQCGKRHNLTGDLIVRIEKLVERGVGVIGGLIVGFDSDPPEIFEQQFEFAMQTPVPSFSVNALMAPPPTPLYRRMAREQRLLDVGEADGPITPWWTNFSPKQMTLGELQSGVRWLIRQLYEPEAFETRMRNFLDSYRAPEGETRAAGKPRRDVNIAAVSVVRSTARLGAEESRMYHRLMSLARHNPALQRHVFANLFRYVQIRTLLEHDQVG